MRRRRVGKWFFWGKSDMLRWGIARLALINNMSFNLSLIWNE